ncbi:MAG TPA: amidohydrolase family protein [Dehalococcoidia bacterium]|nr:amidohydrolase family protein [Dehalococcoidia bacterium]
MRIDFHSHIFPPSFMDHLSGRKEIPRVTPGEKWPLLWYGPEVSVGIYPQASSVERRIEDADKLGIDLEVLSVTLPGVDTLPLSEATMLARRMNDDMARVVSDHPTRFAGLGTVPLQDLPAAISEMEYAVKQLGLKGVAIYSNVAGDPYSRSNYLDFFAAAADLGAVLFMHPTYPAMAHVLGTHGFMHANVGYLADTTLAIANLIYTGVFEKVPGLKIVFAHLGGAAPYLIGRWDHSYGHGYRPEGLTQAPSQYLKRAYLDTISMNPAAIRLAMELMSTDHLVFGSDYPFIDIESNLETVGSLGLSSQDQAKIFETNARQLLGL